MDDEHAHFDNMRGRLHVVLKIHERLGNMLETLRATHASVGVEVEELTKYVGRLAPASPAEDKRDKAMNTPARTPSVLKTLALKLHITRRPSLR
ncbi:hypothetical protein C8Q73DRAFT_789830 [Cubamyces lactineus]|nr:hypothetical protein C8Q73DRAFT_789830 [Cubamyces lactineus]